MNSKSWHSEATNWRISVVILANMVTNSTSRTQWTDTGLHEPAAPEPSWHSFEIPMTAAPDTPQYLISPTQSSYSRITTACEVTSLRIIERKKKVPIYLKVRVG
jgi:hypothetical protein